MGQGDGMSFGIPRREGPRPLTVTELTGRLKGLIEGAFFQVSVQGEISNFRPAASGHLYFSLKDAGASISAVMFAREASFLRFVPSDGMKVVLTGRLSVYAPRGQYQIVCARMEKLGAGELALAFEALKQRLAAEGLFATERKRSLPLIPRCIGVVTSLTGAALFDFLRVLHARFPARVLISPSLVQGPDAPRNLIRALRLLEKSGQPDVIVLTRGGGSMEDLWAFNDEALARAIARCPIPVVSAVGHEIDFTIADFVSDLRCATPTDAARQTVPVQSDLLEMVRGHAGRLRVLVQRETLICRALLRGLSARLGTPEKRVAASQLLLLQRKSGLIASMRGELAEERQALASLVGRLKEYAPEKRLADNTHRLASLRLRLTSAIRKVLQTENARLTQSASVVCALSPTSRLELQTQALRALQNRLKQAAAVSLSEREKSLGALSGRLRALSPLLVLSRGYALAFSEDGRLLRSTEGVQAGDAIRLRLSDGSQIQARVESVSKAETDV